MNQIQLGDILIAVEQKDIKNLHLSVYPPDGRVRIAVPAKMDLDTVRLFALSKLDWIKSQRESLQSQERETPRIYVNLESHYFLGKRYLMRIKEVEAPASIAIDHKYIHLQVRPGTSTEKRQAIIEAWYRAELKKIVPAIITRWEKKIGVKSHAFGIKKMRTKWGSCNTEAKRIWLNLELARKPVECLEYIIVHELVHLLERSHNARFVGFMDEFMPKWRYHRDELNRLPYSHVDWGY